MMVRDVLNAVAKVGGMEVEALLTTQTRGVRSLRHLGYLMSSRLTPVTWAVIGRVWGGRERAIVRNAALKAEARIDQRDPAMAGYLAAVLVELKLRELPDRRPAAAGYRYRYRPSTIRSRIAQTEARLAALRAQLATTEGAHP